jgi:hypothetical protein
MRRQMSPTTHAHRRVGRRRGSHVDPTPPSSSRATTDELLADLRERGLRPRAWARFFGHASARSVQQATARPEALAQLTALHVGLAVLNRQRQPDDGGLRWIACSWALAVTHLGMLEQRRRIGLADVLTLVRANLPALTPHDRTFAAAVAVATDLLDGPIARRAGEPTPFGRDADSLADAAFWSWYALRHEPSRLLRILLVGAWAAPVAAVTGFSVARGRMVDPPRPRRLRPVATVQGILLVRALTRGAGEAARQLDSGTS